MKTQLDTSHGLAFFMNNPYSFSAVLYLPIQINSENCISDTPKVSKYIANLVGVIIFKNSGTNFSNTRDPYKLI